MVLCVRHTPIFELFKTHFDIVLQFKRLALTFLIRIRAPYLLDFFLYISSVILKFVYADTALEVLVYRRIYIYNGQIFKILGHTWRTMKSPSKKGTHTPYPTLYTYSYTVLAHTVDKTHILPLLLCACMSLYECF